jgi:glutamate racemase
VTPEPRERPIGVFDSGVGGLTVLHELLVNLPHEDFVYLGDTARFPYGDRDAAELERFSLEVAEELVARRVKLLVVACNSATAAALPALQRRMMETTLGVDVLGVVKPGAVAAVGATANGRIGLLATPATVRSRAYDKAIAEVDSHTSLVSVECADLAGLIEGGFPVDETLVSTVRAYCEPLRDGGVDTVILGCTHYPLVRPMLQRTLGRAVTIVTSGEAAARQVEHALASRGLDSRREGEGAYRFLCTGDAETFRTTGTRFLQLPLGRVERVEIRSRRVAA